MDLQKQIRAILEDELKNNSKTWISLSDLNDLYYQRYNQEISVNLSKHKFDFRLYKTSSDVFIALPLDHISLTNEQLDYISLTNEPAENNKIKKNILSFPSVINNVEDLEQALLFIIQEQGLLSPDGGSIDIQLLNRYFYQQTNQPLRTVFKKFVTNLRLKEFIKVLVNKQQM